MSRRATASRRNRSIMRGTLLPSRIARSANSSNSTSLIVRAYGTAPAMNSASAGLKAFPETFDEKIRRRLRPELGPLDFPEELSIDVAADVSLGGVALIGHKGFPSISISNCAVAWRDVVPPSRRTGFITCALLVRLSVISSPFGMARLFLTRGTTSLNGRGSFGAQDAVSSHQSYARWCRGGSVPAANLIFSVCA